MAVCSTGAFLGFLFLLFCNVQPARAQFPVPRRFDGFLYGKPAADAVVIEAFMDLLCPSCRAAWPSLKAVAAHYGDEKINIVVHPFSNPFHHYSYYASRGMHAVAGLNASLPIAWMEAIYKRQERFDERATGLQTPASTLERFSDVASDIGVSGTGFLHAFNKEEVDLAARVSFKYGCSRNVVATPTFLVNGAPVAADDRWDLGDWKRLLDPLFENDKNEKVAANEDWAADIVFT